MNSHVQGGYSTTYRSGDDTVKLWIIPAKKMADK
jgi:hypothetical protein